MPSQPKDTSIFEAGQRALQGDPVMIREVLGAAGAFTVRLLVAAVILAVTFWAAKKLADLAKRQVGRLPHHNHPADATLGDFVSGLVRYVVIAIGAVAVLQQLGVQATSVIAVLGAASLAIGLALQGALGLTASAIGSISMVAKARWWRSICSTPPSSITTA